MTSHFLLDDIHVRPQRGRVRDWIDSRFVYEGEERSRCLPTFVRSQPRKKPPSAPRGLARCDAETRQRWKEAMAPYFFARENLILRRDGARILPSVSERELLMGYPRHYAVAALSSTKRKDSSLNFHTRTSLLGDSFNTYKVARLLGSLMFTWGFITKVPTVTELRSGAAREFGKRCPAPIVAFRQNQEWSEMQQFNYLLFTRADARGSDVRLSTGEFHAPNKIRRMAADHRWWRWRSGRGWPWRHIAEGGKEHINCSELRAAYIELKCHCRQAGELNAWYVLAVGSGVAIGVIAKKRSSSWKLNAIMRKFCSYMRASGCEPVTVFFRSEWNPSDKWSRIKWRATADGKARNSFRGRVKKSATKRARHPDRRTTPNAVVGEVSNGGVSVS